MKKLLTNSNSRAHALCSASGAERWSMCPASIITSIEAPFIARLDSNIYSIEGTKAHDIAEKMLKKESVEGEDTEMILHGTGYAEYINKEINDFKDLTSKIETKLTLSSDLNMYGYVDFAAIGRIEGEWHGLIVDYKYGKTKVDAKDNLQLLFYAAALMRMSRVHLSQIKTVIYQPRIINGVSEYVYNREKVSEMSEYLLNAGNKALLQAAGGQERSYTVGSWCKYCKGRTICPEKNKIKDVELDFIQE